jgi:hypothetical protein
MREANGLPGVPETGALIERVLGGADAEARSRGAVERLAQLAAAGALQTSGQDDIAALFARTRLVSGRGGTYGTAAINAAEAAAVLSHALPDR